MIDLKHLPNPIPGERLVFFLRRHPITLLPLIVSIGAIILIPIAVWWYIQTQTPEILDQPTILTIIVLGGSGLFLWAWLFLFQYFLDYYLDMWIVTTRRVIAIQQIGLFGRTVSELRLNRIQDITATVKGIAHTMFDFGFVEIQTAAEEKRFLFEDVSNPNHVAKIILELAEVDRREHLQDAVEEFHMPERQQNTSEH